MPASKPSKVLAFERLRGAGLASWLEKPESWNKKAFAKQIRKAMADAYGIEVEFDEHLITMLADQMDTYVKAAHRLLEEELVEICHNGARMANPNQKIRDTALAKIMQLLTMLGLVPSGRPKRANTPTDIDELLGGVKYG
jgi:P27 family predicted phage terminase small subunit